MRKIEPVSLETARELVDFGGGVMSKGLAEEQLQGAVSLHNILAKRGFAYLADEVGMGKTYVALGVVGLLRFFHPHVRILYITPRENIQLKWRKELQNFVRNNWKWTDQRVKSIHETPLVDVAVCGNLADWARRAVRAPDRDFLLRMTSFSFPLSNDSRQWREKRKEILRLAFFLERSAMDLRDKETFKYTYAQAVSALLPHYDLVVVDEAHNFKHGRKSHAARNRVLRHVLGLGEEGFEPRVPNYSPRFDRVLLLSATPLENDYEQLWRQLDLFGFGQSVKVLCDPELKTAEKKEIASGFLVRRLTGLRIGGELHTKNMYRREWRGGGCDQHDDPLEVPDDRQRLIVALVQKKVAEVLQDERFGASFQIGMLASFESFFRTAKVKKDDDANFDAAEQTDSELEKEGIDTPAINKLSDSYWREFGEALPHPKMDSLVESLSWDISSGEKTLVFVRRVKSVDEIGEKLCRKYDDWLRGELKGKLPEKLHGELARAWDQYEAERRKKRRRTQAAGDELEPMEEGTDTDALHVGREDVEDPGGNDTFFAWFFRGDGPAGWLSGAAFRKNRFMSQGSAYATFFADNHVSALLGSPDDAFAALATELGASEEECLGRLRKLAFTTFRRASRQAKYQRLPVFHAYQAAGLALLAHSASELRRDARVALREQYPGAALREHRSVPGRHSAHPTRDVEVRSGSWPLPGVWSACPWPASAADFEGVRGGHGAFRAQAARLRRVPEDDLRGVVRQDPPGIRARCWVSPWRAPHCCRAMQRLARRAKPTRDALVEALRASPVVYADETGWKQGGRRVWLWVFTNLRETVYEILPGRGFEQAASVLGKNYAGTLGVDGWAPYRCFKEATLQTCYNHLLHRCHELLETATRGAVRFPRLVKAILRHALALRDRRDAGEISPHGLRVAKGLLQAKMNRLLHGRFTNPANQRFAKHLRRYRDNLFVFLDRADVEATNYPAEQDIRIAVVNRKTCGGGNRTAKGAQAQSICSGSAGR